MGTNKILDEMSKEDLKNFIKSYNIYIQDFDYIDSGEPVSIYEFYDSEYQDMKSDALIDNTLTDGKKLNYLKETKEQLLFLKDKFIDAFKNIKELGYASEKNPEKNVAIDILEQANYFRDTLIETNLFPNGLSKINFELDWNDTLESILKQFNNISSEINEIIKSLEANNNLDKMQIQTPSIEECLKEIKQPQTQDLKL